MRIDQLLPGFGSGDAISNYALQLQEIINSWGFQSSIYCVRRHVSSKVDHLCKDCASFPSPGDPEDIVIYHYSIGSPLSELFARLKGHRVLIFHNITPHHYFAGIHEEKMRSLWEGREQLKELTGVTDLAIGVSEFNRRELKEDGFKDTAVLPLIVDRARLSAEPDTAFMKKYRDDCTNLLFVGRMAPNKKVEDLIKIFFYYRKVMNKRSRLLLAGSSIGMDRYIDHLRMLITTLDIPDVVFCDHVKDPELYALYRASRMLVCMSEHEGFCLPLLEAMHFRLPVLAYAAGAVPETLGGAGVLVKEKDPAYIAELIDMILGSPELEEAIVRKQLTRLDAFSRESVSSRLRPLLSGWLRVE
jgi:glycosyltransferase involved in cell wall biosynthesis